MSPREARRARAAARRRDRADVVLTPHAAQRRVEHGFSEDDVLMAVALPEQSYPCAAHYGPGRRMYQRHRVAVVVDEASRVVVTVLPRVQERWEHRESRS